MFLERHLHDVLEVLDLGSASLGGFVVMGRRSCSAFIMTGFQAGFLLLPEDFLEFLFSEFIDCFLIVGQSSIDCDLLDLLFNPTSDHSVYSFLFIDGKPWRHVLTCALFRLFDFFLNRNFRLKRQLIFIFLEFVIHCGLILPFLQ